MRQHSALYIMYDGLTDPLGQSQVIPYLQGLSRRGIKFTVLSYEKKDRFSKHKKRIREILKQDNIDWMPLRYHKSLRLSSTLYDVSRGYRKALALYKRSGFKVVHCRSYIASIIGERLSRRIDNIRFVFDMRGFWIDERKEGGILSNKLIFDSFKKLEKNFINNSDAIISLTENAINDMKTWPQVKEKHWVKMHHITTCVNVKKFEKAFFNNSERDFDENKIEFLYIGSIGPWHSFEHVSKFIRIAYDKYPGSKFNLIVSNGLDQMQRHLEEQNYSIDRMDLRSVNYDDIPEQIGNADIGFFFIPPTKAKIASSPTKMGEMLAAGLPIITGSKIGDVDRLIEQNKIGKILHEISDETIASALDDLVAMMKENRQFVSQRCLDTCNDYFSLEKGVEKYFEIYNEWMQISD